MFERLFDCPRVLMRQRAGPLLEERLRYLCHRADQGITRPETMPSVAKKRVSPHTIRHTTAMHLLRAGVDINTIRAWLGHVSLATTNVYAEVDLEMKAKALANCEIKEEGPPKPYREDKGLMEFLRSL